jgi:hypothetical protein
MDQSRNEGKIKKGTGPLGICPYLGVQDDPASHYMWAKPGHFCYRVRPSQAINIRHQENFCMNGRYPACPVYPASWRGALPPEVRDESFVDWATRAAVIKTSITTIGISQPAREEPEKSTSKFGMDLSSLRDQADFVEEEEPVLPWWKMRWGRLALIALIVLPLIVLSAWAIIFTTRASQDIPPTEQSLAVSNLTATWEAVLAVLPADTSTATAPPPTSTPTPDPTATPTLTPTETPNGELTSVALMPSETATPGATETATPVPYTCDGIEAYTYELVTGPILTPEPGYVYLPGNAGPPVRSTWVIKNTGPCTWNEVLLLSESSNRLLVPFLRIGGQLVIPDYTKEQVSIAPGEQVEVLLGFSQSVARGIKSEWALVLNGFRLTDQPHLVLDVNNWIIVNIPTTRPESPRVSKPPADEPPSIRP